MAELNMTLKGVPMTGLTVGKHKVYGSPEAIAALQEKLNPTPKTRGRKKKSDA